MSPESCLVKSHIEKMTRTVTVGHTSHIYKIGHRRILNRDTCRTGAADAWVFAGRQCEKILHPFFFFFFIYIAVFAKHYMYMRHTQKDTSQDLGVTFLIMVHLLFSHYCLSFTLWLSFHFSTDHVFSYFL